ncbi:MAG: hypothetical protein KGZ92_00380 [Firmicutes bacterium]|nr:hypothetical protein [Dethiobacter sp.]MBS3887744.1 hypothetical protein [Bacillota bacterium]MBS4053909.1 hypothetical protein [Thermaerobacter sp.]
MAKGKKKKSPPKVEKKQAPKIEMWVYMVGGGALGLLAWMIYRAVTGQ